MRTSRFIECVMLVLSMSIPPLFAALPMDVQQIVNQLNAGQDRIDLDNAIVSFLNTATSETDRKTVIQALERYAMWHQPVSVEHGYATVKKARDLLRDFDVRPPVRGKERGYGAWGFSARIDELMSKNEAIAEQLSTLESKLSLSPSEAAYVIAAREHMTATDRIISELRTAQLVTMWRPADERDVATKKRTTACIDEALRATLGLAHTLAMADQPLFSVLGPTLVAGHLAQWNVRLAQIFKHAGETLISVLDEEVNRTTAEHRGANVEEFTVYVDVDGLGTKRPVVLYTPKGAALDAERTYWLPAPARAYPTARRTNNVYYKAMNQHAELFVGSPAAVNIKKKAISDLMQKGYQAKRDGRWQDALVCFEKAYELDRSLPALDRCSQWMAGAKDPKTELDAARAKLRELDSESSAGMVSLPTSRVNGNVSRAGVAMPAESSAAAPNSKPLPLTYVNRITVQTPPPSPVGRSHYVIESITDEDAQRARSDLDKLLDEADIEDALTESEQTTLSRAGAQAVKAAVMNAGVTYVPRTIPARDANQDGSEDAEDGTPATAAIHMPNNAAVPTYTLQEAVARGLVDVVPQGTGDLYGDTALKLVIHKKTSEPFRLLVPKGTMIQSDSGTTQNVVIR